MARRGARPGDWKVRPLPSAVERLCIERSFHARELARLREGLVPERMEDRWFVLWEEGWLRLYRSWSGSCVFQLRFTPLGEGFRIEEALLNREPGEGATGESRPLIEMLQRLLSELLSL